MKKGSSKIILLMSIVVLLLIALGIALHLNLLNLLNLTGFAVYGNTTSNICGNGMVENYSSQEIFNNHKDSTQYTQKKVFLISDKDWKDFLSLIPVTTWTGNESWCKKGYGTPSDVCIYPTLAYHVSNEIKNITPASWSSFSSSVMVYVEKGSNLTSQYTNPCSTYKDKLYLMRPTISPTQLSVGDNFLMNITIMNCNLTNSLNVTGFKVYFSSFSKYVSNYSTLFADNEKTIAPNSSKKLQVELKFNSSLAEAVDIDSIIHFMQQYTPDSLTIIGSTTNETDYAIVGAKPFGANISNNSVERITTQAYFSYWGNDNFNTIIYSEDKYETALFASVYASVHNSPLIIKNSSLDNLTGFSDKILICVGNPSSFVNSACNYKYSLEQIRQKYNEEVKPGKLLILTNPEDLTKTLVKDFKPVKTGNIVYELYNKNSMASAILASAKHETIISITNTARSSIMEELRYRIRQYYNDDNPSQYYLTIMGSPSAIPFRPTQPRNEFKITPITTTDDPWGYGVINDQNGKRDLIVGRIAGITFTDTSAYLARDLFYSDLFKTDNTIFLAKDPTVADLTRPPAWSSIFSSAGYNSTYKLNGTWSSTDYKNKQLVFFVDHGNSATSGLSSLSIPEMDNTLNFEMSCSSCSSFGTSDTSYCARLFRQGSLLATGAIDLDTAGMVYIYMNAANGIYYEGKSLGKAWFDAFDVNVSRINYGADIQIMLGDPTFELNPKYKINTKLTGQ